MTEASPVFRRIPETMRAPLAGFADLVRKLAGANAKALTLFGRIVDGTLDPRQHVVRSVLVLERVDLSMLRDLSAHGLKFGKSSIAAPLIMTPPYIRSSLDVFPLELLDIQMRHLTLFGNDYFTDLTFEDAHVRLQCERELKVVLIGLRQGLLASTGSEKLIGALERDAAEGLMRTLRGLLWLRGRREATPAMQVLNEVEELVGRKLAGLRTALDPAAHHGWQQFESLYHDVEAVGELANAW